MCAASYLSEFNRSDMPLNSAAHTPTQGRTLQVGTYFSSAICSRFASEWISAPFHFHCLLSQQHPDSLLCLTFANAGFNLVSLIGDQ